MNVMNETDLWINRYKISHFIYRFSVEFKLSSIAYTDLGVQYQRILLPFALLWYWSVSEQLPIPWPNVVLFLLFPAG